MALLPALVADRRDRPAGEYGPVYERQLLRACVLARVASQFQPVDYTIHLRATWWESSQQRQSSGELHRCFHVRGIMARYQPPPAGLGVVSGVVRAAGTHCFVLVPGETIRKSAGCVPLVVWDRCCRKYFDDDGGEFGRLRGRVGRFARAG